MNLGKGRLFGLYSTWKFSIWRPINGMARFPSEYRPFIVPNHGNARFLFK